MLGPDIRFVTRKWPPAVGGMETYSARMAEELAKRGSLDLVTLPGKASGQAPSVLALVRFAAWTAARLLKAPAARVVHIGDLAAWPLGWIASIRHPRTRIIVSAHGSDVSFGQRPGWRSMLYRRYLEVGAAALGRAYIIANSAYIANLARCAGFRHIRVVSLATDLDAEIGGKRKHLLYAGRISRAKGLRFIIERVIPLLPPGTRLRVAGTVWEQSEVPLLSHPAVDYLGVLAPGELAAEYAQAAAVLVPTRESEGFGLVAIEAAACGSYAIASHHSGLTDIVRPPIGTTVDADDPGAWADAIRSVLSKNDRDRLRDAQLARDEVDRNYRWPRVADETWSIYFSR